MRPSSKLHMPMSEEFDEGEKLYQWVRDLFPLNRSLTGPGLRSTLDYLGALIPGLRRHSVPSGTQVEDWQVPLEWRIYDAYISDESGNRILDFRHNNLHVVGYSTPVDARLTLAELNQHLYSLETQPDAIPYVTSYYSPTWGFCISHNQRRKLRDEIYRVVIDSEFVVGQLDYADIVIQGSSEREVFLTTYICHPSMANNELSGPAVLAATARWLLRQPRLKYSYRILFAPETLGAVTYLSQHMARLKRDVLAGWVLTCIGDDGAFSHIRSRYGNNLSDRIASRVVNRDFQPTKEYSFLDRGSDERQWTAPGVDLPMSTLTRTKFGSYSQYHTSLDDLDFVTPTGLAGGFALVRKCVEEIEGSDFWRVTTVGEPQMGRRGLYPTTSQTATNLQSRELMNVLAFCDGFNDVQEIAQYVGMSVDEVTTCVRTLEAAQVIDL